MIRLQAGVLIVAFEIVNLPSVRKIPNDVFSKCDICTRPEDDRLCGCLLIVRWFDFWS